MNFPRWRWLAVALFVAFVYMLVLLNFDALLAIQHWVVKVVALIAAILGLLKYVQEQLRIITTDFQRDVEQPSFWGRVW